MIFISTCVHDGGIHILKVLLQIRIRSFFLLKSCKNQNLFIFYFSSSVGGAAVVVVAPNRPAMPSVKIVLFLWLWWWWWCWWITSGDVYDDELISGNSLCGQPDIVIYIALLALHCCNILYNYNLLTYDNWGLPRPCVLVSFGPTFYVLYLSIETSEIFLSLGHFF